MGKKKSKNGGKAAGEKAAKATEAKESKVSKVEFDALRKPIDEAKAKLEKVQVEAKVLAEKARAAVVEAKDAYRTALTPYREACRKTGVACEYEVGRSANVSEKVSFLVEKTDKGVRVMVRRTYVRGRPAEG
ncbi:MAG: hypothetical protein HYY16_12170, partial [Planctomycetes bacterium]|nr:hypothetical protein [Planctomycetota bacterium]